MKKNNVVKIVATIIILSMTLTNIILLKVYVSEERKTLISNTKVYFDAYFKSNETQIYEKKADTDNENINLYISIKVEEGSLKTSEISLKNSNFSFKRADEEFTYIENIDNNENKITLKQISAGEKIELSIPIEINNNSNNYTKISKICLNGNYINNNEENIEIKDEEREVKLTKNMEGFGTEMIMNTAEIKNNDTSQEKLLVSLKTKDVNKYIYNSRNIPNKKMNRKGDINE